MSLAVIRAGGKQYIVREGMKLKIEKIHGKPGDNVVFPELLLFSDDADVEIGMPFLHNIRAEGKIISHGKKEKLIVFRYKSKTRHRRRRGHRQPYTEIEITKIARAAPSVAKSTGRRRAAKPKTKTKTKRPTKKAV